MREMTVVAALVALACGGDKGGQSGTIPGARAPASPAATTAAPGTGVVHEIKMQLVKGKYSFEPSALTIKVGDTVKWINWSGGPHNVQFKKDKIPAGAAPILDAAMPDRMGSLTGKFLIDSLATYQVSFANAPVGTYAYTCQPHEMLGMNGTLTVQP